jgi:type I restriction enzyme R subunit
LDTDDLAQETVLKALARPTLPKRESDRRRFLHRLMANLLHDHLDAARDFKRHEGVHPSTDEVASSAALADRPEVFQQMADATLKHLATELTDKLHQSITVDWQVRECVRAKMRLLRKYKYPPENPEEAVKLVLEQAGALADAWSGQTC